MPNALTTPLRPSTAAMIAARAAVVAGTCQSQVVILALDTLEHVHELRGDAAEVERAERYVAECWAEFARGMTRDELVEELATRGVSLIGPDYGADDFTDDELRDRLMGAELTGVS